MFPNPTTATPEASAGESPDFLAGLFQADTEILTAGESIHEVNSLHLPQTVRTGLANALRDVGVISTLELKDLIIAHIQTFLRSEILQVGGPIPRYPEGSAGEITVKLARMRVRTKTADLNDTNRMNRFLMHMVYLVTLLEEHFPTCVEASPPHWYTGINYHSPCVSGTRITINAGEIASKIVLEQYAKYSISGSDEDVVGKVLLLVLQDYIDCFPPTAQVSESDISLIITTFLQNRGISDTMRTLLEFEARQYRSRADNNLLLPQNPTTPDLAIYCLLNRLQPGPFGPEHYNHILANIFPGDLCRNPVASLMANLSSHLQITELETAPLPDKADILSELQRQQTEYDPIAAYHFTVQTLLAWINHSTEVWVLLFRMALITPTLLPPRLQTNKYLMYIISSIRKSLNRFPEPSDKDKVTTILHDALVSQTPVLTQPIEA